MAAPIERRRMRKIPVRYVIQPGGYVGVLRDEDAHKEIADIKAYIDRLNQPTEDDMIANSLIAANKYFTVNNRLFLSTASIAAGAQIIPGTNCTETSLAAALNALNA